MLTRRSFVALGTATTLGACAQDTVTRAADIPDSTDSGGFKTFFTVWN